MVAYKTLWLFVLGYLTLDIISLLWRTEEQFVSALSQTNDIALFIAAVWLWKEVAKL